MKASFFLMGILLLASCKTKDYFLSKRATCIVVFSFERASMENQEFYFLSSSKLMFNNKFFDVESHFPESIALKKDIEKVIAKNYPTSLSGTREIPSISDCKYFSKEDTLGESLFSDYFYYKEGNNNVLYIIYAIRGDVLIINNCNDSDLVRLNHRYSCPINEDLLNIPFYVVTDIQEFYSPENQFFIKYSFRKSKVQSIKLYYCD